MNDRRATTDDVDNNTRRFGENAREGESRSNRR